MKWETGNYDPDPTVNAILNVAAELAHLSDQVNELVYVLGDPAGEPDRTVIEAIDNLGKNIAATMVAIG